MFRNNAQNQFLCFPIHLVNQIDFHQRGLLRVCKTRKQSTHMIRIVPNALSGAPTQPDPNESDALQSGEKLPAWELQPMHIGYFVSKEQNWGKSKQFKAKENRQKMNVMLWRRKKKERRRWKVGIRIRRDFGELKRFPFPQVLDFFSKIAKTETCGNGNLFFIHSIIKMGPNMISGIVGSLLRWIKVEVNV